MRRGGEIGVERSMRFELDVGRLVDLHVGRKAGVMLRSRSFTLRRLISAKQISNPGSLLPDRPCIPQNTHLQSSSSSSGPNSLSPNPASALTSPPLRLLMHTLLKRLLFLQTHRLSLLPTGPRPTRAKPGAVRWVVVFREDALPIGVEDEEGGDGVEGEVCLMWRGAGDGDGDAGRLATKRGFGEERD